MEIETVFAATVVNAARYAVKARKHGYRQTTGDQIDCAISDLWDAARAEGLPRREVQAIVDRYVDVDANGEARARPMGNVVPFAR
jgi:hypothetical protein